MKRPVTRCPSAAVTPLVLTLVMCSFALPAHAQTPAARRSSVDIQVLENAPERITISCVIPQPRLETVTRGARAYTRISLDSEGLLMEAGAPELPRVCRSFIIPDDVEMAARVVSSEQYIVRDVDLLPSQGHLARNVDPTTVPTTPGPVYSQNADYPGALATLRAPYILRDFRGAVLELNPIQYNPVTRVLTVYTKLTVELVTTGPGTQNVLNRHGRALARSRAFDPIYRDHFVNYATAARSIPFDEAGEMLIVVASNWRSLLVPLANHRIAQGTPTAVGVPCGLTVDQLHAYLKELYASSNLTYVLLVGDWVQMPTPPRPFWYQSDAAADPVYSLVAGDDPYPDILVGRFSAQTITDVRTQVQRTLEYDTQHAISQEWFKRATGIASDYDPGPEGESDAQHIEGLRTDLLAYGYSLVDQFYYPDVSEAAVTAALDAGRGMINYCGLATHTSWSHADFYTTSVNALQNAGMLPFITSAAGSDGGFSAEDDPSDCLAERWMKAVNGTSPIGAIGVYAASAPLDWVPPMCAQDEIVDRLVDESYTTFGALCYAGACKMLDEYGEAGADNFYIWNLFGDPSVRIARTCVQQGTLALDRELYPPNGVVTARVADCGVNTSDTTLDTATITIVSNAEPAGESVVLTETRPDSGLFTGTLNLSLTDAPGVLQVNDHDALAATYIDADDGQGGTNVAVTVRAGIDNQPPTISNVHVRALGRRTATIAFDADEPVRGTIRYGRTCDALTQLAVGDMYATTIEVQLTDLADDAQYYFVVDAEDEAGQVTTDDAQGACHTFATPDGPDYFTEQFYWDFDLDNTSVTFAPGWLLDSYTACVESLDALPTDPSGGTILDLAETGSASLILHELGISGRPSLYGIASDWLTIYADGWVEFGSNGDDPTESLEEHFAIRRICGLWNDFDPTMGGTISWKSLDDRIAVTYENLPEYASWAPVNSNTFQIELFFDGRIRLSYFGISATCGIVGLSNGGGVPADFYESDLSALRTCGPQPPRIEFGTAAAAPAGRPVTIELRCYDDGLPDGLDALAYVITALPAGRLRDPANGHAIRAEELPYTLSNHGAQVTYTSGASFSGADPFHYLADDGGTPPTGGASNEGTVLVEVTPSLIEPVYMFALDEDPGWTTEGAWEFGVPAGGGSSWGDPTSGYTGQNVYGYNLQGDYPVPMPDTHYLTTTAIDCTGLSNVHVRYWRWLGVGGTNYGDEAIVQVSADGSSWTRLWSAWSFFDDYQWNLQNWDMSAVADGQPTVYVRWGLGPTTWSPRPGWNIDDIEIWASVPPPSCPGDLNCDGVVSFADINPFVLYLSNNATWASTYVGCNPQNGDINGDGNYPAFSDINPFVSLLSTSTLPIQCN